MSEQTMLIRVPVFLGQTVEKWEKEGCTNQLQLNFHKGKIGSIEYYPVKKERLTANTFCPEIIS